MLRCAGENTEVAREIDLCGPTEVRARERTDQGQKYIIPRSRDQTRPNQFTHLTPSHAVYVAHASAAWLKSGFVPHPPSPIPVPTAMSTLSLRASRCSLVTWVQLSRSWTDGKRRMGGRSKQQTWAWQWQQPQHAQQKSQQLRLVFFANSQQTQKHAQQPHPSQHHS